MLQEYNQVIEGAAERILHMAESQSTHRQDMERRVVFGANRRANVGLVMGFVIALVVLIASFLLITNGYEIAGSVFGGTTLPSLAAVFVYGRRGQERERAAKRRERGR